jgi:hypothetical protein
LFILRLSADITMDPFFCESGWDRGGSALDSMWLVIRRRQNYADATWATTQGLDTSVRRKLIYKARHLNYC